MSAPQMSSSATGALRNHCHHQAADLQCLGLLQAEREAVLLLGHPITADDCLHSHLHPLVAGFFSDAAASSVLAAGAAAAAAQQARSFNLTRAY